MGASGLVTQVLTDPAPFPIFWMGPGDEANVKEASLVFWWEEFPVLISLLLPLIFKETAANQFPTQQMPSPNEIHTHAYVVVINRSRGL